MKVIETINEMQTIRLKLKEPVGFVPTMGYLHAGHMSLVRFSVAGNRTTIVSIYVNPTQFGPKEDLSKYPRDLNRDLSMLEKEGADIVFFPVDKEMYPEGYDTWVTVENLTKPLEGDSRPTHFRGVTTIVNKLFNIVRPANAYFGQKDAQQALVIKKMAKDLNMNLKVVVCPTVREPDGLAMSSRNVYLTPEQRKGAPVLYKSLLLAKDMFAIGERNAAVILEQMTLLIQKEMLANIDYISINDTETLAELKTIKKSALVSMAVRFGNTRLIDNLILGQ
ncbi:MAG: pantoate--beta-alanine ligase [Dehalococcoidales bacterium]|nr:pantoate--beta-alanine ligase [Dehalococcoidales bacterium]